MSILVLKRHLAGFNYANISMPPGGDKVEWRPLPGFLCTVFSSKVDFLALYTNTLFSSFGSFFGSVGSFFKLRKLILEALLLLKLELGGNEALRRGADD